MPNKSLVRRWMASCSGSYGCSLLGISRMAGDFCVKPSTVGLIIDARYWLMSTMATSEREVNRLKASSICGGVVSAGRRARAEVRKGVGASAQRGCEGELT